MDQHLGPAAHTGQKGQREEQHAHAPDPGGEGPPEQDAAGQGLDVCQDGAAGGGEAGDDLEETVGKALKFPGEPEGQGPEQTERQPDEAHHGEALAGEEGVTGRDPGQGEAQQGHGDDGIEEGAGVFVVPQGDQQGQQETEGFHLERPPQHTQHELIVHRPPPSELFKDVPEGLDVGAVGDDDDPVPGRQDGAAGGDDDLLLVEQGGN